MWQMPALISNLNAFEGNLDLGNMPQNDYEIIFEDERLTSRQAEKNLTTMGKKWTKNKGMVDKESASIILQQYLDKIKK